MSGQSGGKGPRRGLGGGALMLLVAAVLLVLWLASGGIHTRTLPDGSTNVSITTPF